MAKQSTLLTSMLAVTLLAMLGCSQDDRLARMAQDATERQAEQNREMARLNQEVAENSQRLIEADAESRREVIQLQRDLIERDADGREQLDALQRETQAAVSQERSSVDRQREKLEEERKQIAAQRNRDPIVAAAITGLAVVLACLAPIILAIYLLRTADRHQATDAELAELLVQELVADEPLLLPPPSERSLAIERDRPPESSLAAPGSEEVDDALR
jgi:hypothetical protein